MKGKAVEERRRLPALNERIDQDRQALVTFRGGPEVGRLQLPR